MLLLSTMATAAGSSRTAVRKPSAKASVKSVTANAGAKTSKKKRTAKSRRTSWRSRGQQSIEASRAREIQEKLIEAGYLSGNADGRWDDRTKAAMRKFQEDNGWQTKILPDSRALIKLGLGPNYSNVVDVSSLPHTQQGSND